MVKGRMSLETEPLRISAAARSAGVSRQTVEYYMMIGLIAPLRVPGRHGRFFDERLVRRIRLIRRLNRSGYTLREIRRTYLRRPVAAEK
jgi:DNA-binding transcriptional MerR regulator